jgi:hypothetical protein
MNVYRQYCELELEVAEFPATKIQKIANRVVDDGEIHGVGILVLLKGSSV